MDWSSIMNLPNVGWATAVAMAIALTGLILGARYEAHKKRIAELAVAAQAYRDAVASGDPDRIHITAIRLQRARRAASLTTDGIPLP